MYVIKLLSHLFFTASDCFFRIKFLPGAAGRPERTAVSGIDSKTSRYLWKQGIWMKRKTVDKGAVHFPAAPYYQGYFLVLTVLAFDHADSYFLPFTV